MVFCIESEPFDVELFDSNCPTQNHVTLNGFPTFFNDEGKYIEPLNYWFNFQANVKRSKDLNSSCRALKRYWEYLEKHQLKWNVFPKQKTLKPTYLYRNHDLLQSVKEGNLKASTASLYMNHVIKFYEWAAYEKLIDINEENKPFDVEYVQVKPYGMMSWASKPFAVRSTDLKIRVPKRSETQKLSPLSEEEIKAYIELLESMSIEFQIHQYLQLLSGLRISEACTFPEELVFHCSPSQNLVEVEIGPHLGVKTKYGKTRKIEINSTVMNMMHRYLVSERRQNRIRKSKNLPQPLPLLLNRNGNSYETSTIYEQFYRLKGRIRALPEHIHFSHQPHDLRSTYGTYRLDSLLAPEVGMTPVDALTLLMGWMGHNDEKTTWKYLRYLKTKELKKQSLSKLDQIVEKVLNRN